MLWLWLSDEEISTYDDLLLFRLSADVADCVDGENLCMIKTLFLQTHQTHFPSQHYLTPPELQSS